MTNKDAIVRHLIWLASDNPDRPGDKAYAWSQAKYYASLLPAWGDIPEILKQRMNAVREALLAEQ